MVYLCEDTRDGSRVAVKVLRREVANAVANERFLREIELCSHLEHPRIPKVLDSGVMDDVPFYVMTYVEGESLRARITREIQMPIPEAVRIACAAIEPMAYAHKYGIIHRDIKPENILLAPDGVYVLDFGVARAIIEAAGDRLTSTGVALGTPAYMSPEQALGDHNLDARSDIYALGCVIYEMIAGLPPFVGATPQAVISRRFASAPAPLRDVREEIPESVERAISVALAKVPADRWGSAEEFGSALQSQDSGPSRAGVRKGFWNKHRYRKPAAVTGAAIIAAVAGGVAWSATRQSDAPSNPESAVAALDPRRVAVLYFDDHSSEKNLEYLASGLTESLIHELSSVPAIQVVSRNGVKRFRDSPIGLDSVAAVLRAGTLVEGSVQRSGNRIRVTAQVIDGRTNSHLESTTLDHNMGELFVLEDELAHQVAAMLRRRIGFELRLRQSIQGTEDSKARELKYRADKTRDDAELASSEADSVARARGFALLRTADSLLAEAERADPEWIAPVISRGWIALDAALRLGDQERDNAFRRAEKEATRALKREGTNAAALELLGTISYYAALRIPLTDTDFSRTLIRAQRALERAVARDSTLATAWATLSRVRIARGDIGAAQQDARNAFAMDAFLKDAADVLISLYIATLMRDSLRAAWHWCERGSRDHPRDPRFLECRLTLLAEDVGRRPNPRLAWKLLADGDRLDPPERARAAGRPYLPLYRQMMAAIVSARAGITDSANALAERANRAAIGDPELSVDVLYEDAYLQLTLGDKAKAIELLGKYLRARPSLKGLVSQHPRWRSLRRDPAFVGLLKSVG